MFAHGKIRIILIINLIKEGDFIRQEKSNLDRLIIGERIRSLRENQGYKREDFADMAGISNTFLVDIENGSKGMSMYTLARIADCLHAVSYTHLAKWRISRRSVSRIARLC